MFSIQVENKYVQCTCTQSTRTVKFRPKLKYISRTNYRSLACILLKPVSGMITCFKSTRRSVQNQWQFYKPHHFIVRCSIFIKPDLKNFPFRHKQEILCYVEVSKNKGKTYYFATYTKTSTFSYIAEEMMQCVAWKKSRHFRG